MQNSLKILLVSIFLFATFIGCKELYESPVNSPKTGYLVVEGAINSGEGATEIILSRTTALENIQKLYEKGAKVSIEGEDKSSLVLKEKVGGTYTGENLKLNPNLKYRLKIITTSDKTYQSDFVPVNENPPMDSLTWKREKNGGVQFYINTKGPKNNSNYYQWEYSETWEYHAEKTSAIKYEIVNQSFNRQTYKAVYRYPKTPGVFDSSLFFCWQQHTNSNLLIANSEKLTEDVIYQPLVFIPFSSPKFNILYSIIVKQLSWTKEGYEFLERMQKNTEKTGSIFDAQPSQLNSNIHNINDANEPVIGFITICPIRVKRIFLNKNNFPDWDFQKFYCENDTIQNTNTDITARGKNLIPTFNGPCNGCEALDIKIFYAALPSCVDCTTQGGKNIRPSFWPK